MKLGYQTGVGSLALGTIVIVGNANSIENDGDADGGMITQIYVSYNSSW